MTGRTDRFRVWVNQLTGNCAYDVPSDVLERIRGFLGRHNRPVTIASVKFALSRLKLGLLYCGCIGHIIMALTNDRSQTGFLDLDEQTVRDLNAMFGSVEASRRKILPHMYVLFKLLERIDHPERFKLHMIRSKELAAQFDEIWRTICDDLGWTNA